MSHTFDELQQATVRLGRPGLAGTGITQGEKTQLVSDVIALKEHRIEDHPGTAISDPQAGQVLAYDAEGNLVNQAVAQGTIGQIKANTALFAENVGRLDFGPEFELTGDATETNINLRFGPGVNQVAAGPHLHTVLTPLRFVYAGTGVALSSGSRPLVNELVGGFEVGVPMAVTLRGYVHAQGVDDLARFAIVLGIDGVTSSSTEVGGPEPAFVAEWGVNGQWVWEFGRVITPVSGSSGSRAVTLSVQRVAGSLDIVSGFLVVERGPAR